MWSLRGSRKSMGIYKRRERRARRGEDDNGMLMEKRFVTERR